jgi:DNA (cytosine-5)-methyltransferase 1
MKPRLLDLFCGAGGAAMGYARAGFEVVGVDIKPQPHYPFEFIQGDAMAFLRDGPTLTHGERIDVIHASPPCQRYSIANNIHQNDDHPDLLPETRRLLLATGLPYVIENVPGAPMQNYAVACGLALGVNVKRHRWFESSELLMMPPCPKGHPGDWLLVFGHTVLERGHQVGVTAKRTARHPKGGPVIPDAAMSGPTVDVRPWASTG